MSGTSEISGISDGFDRSSFTPDLVFDLCSMDASALHSYTSSLSNVIGNADFGSEVSTNIIACVGLLATTLYS